MTGAELAVPRETLFEFLCRMGDNTLVLGHRLSEWCGHAPVLEEDIAIANTALDLIGQTQMWLGLAGTIEGKARDADALAMRRDVWDFRNILLVEQPNGDFGQTLMRQCLFDHWHLLLLQALEHSSDARIAEIAAKSVKEVTYHAERSSELVVSLGDGTEESRARMQAALTLLWPYVAEMFETDAHDTTLSEAGIAPTPESLRAPYMDAMTALLTAATLSPPDTRTGQTGGRSGKRHSEHLGHMLTTMQWLQRAYPDARW
ncbi:1,2-phenylacetyl-CoA epoxidase subunit PaaC [Cognatishimia sp. F0-27]|uniref:1,2-phenylacetyl-CoA epoxidase subunit PaaC n=1 Tax=Cognatishimia sp. F0-27 TaxID=2816855 RepID=UPI001D0CA00E|nr:1,2-phenylacetyl-CoA epoxidase subunit PaaC [Cognatishimia sp. F0-27]MCC1492611.1 phenylacetate-CoA oxygenase subunit PaaC [Cognatishimia sp. F0-27]